MKEKENKRLDRVGEKTEKPSPVRQCKEGKGVSNTPQGGAFQG
jgi:hypothetical protein